jgi:hypothetical protein
MHTRLDRAARGVATVIVALTAACSGGAKEAPSPATSGAAPPAAAPAQDAPSSAGVQVLTRPKFSDDEYMAAITELEGTNGNTDAAADIASGRKQVLGIRSTAFPEFPGLTIPRNKIPEDVRIERIAGFVDGSENRHIVRFQMLAQKYATEYNSAMMRGAQ